MFDSTLYPKLGFLTRDWFNPEVFYSSLSILESTNSSEADTETPLPPSLTRRHLCDTPEIPRVAESVNGGLLHALKNYLPVSAVRVGRPSDNLSGASPIPLQPVVYALSFANIVLLFALVISLFGLGRRYRYGDGEIKF